MAVEHRPVHPVGGDVDIAVGAGQRLELDGGRRTELPVAGGEIQFDPVAVGGDQRSALDGLGAGQIGKHGLQPILD